MFDTVFIKKSDIWFNITRIRILAKSVAHITNCDKITLSLRFQYRVHISDDKWFQHSKEMQRLDMSSINYYSQTFQTGSAFTLKLFWVRAISAGLAQ